MNWQEIAAQGYLPFIVAVCGIATLAGGCVIAELITKDLKWLSRCWMIAVVGIILSAILLVQVG